MSDQYQTNGGSTTVSTATTSSNSFNYIGNTCPNCGYCPCCGRPRYGQWPYYPCYYQTPSWTFTSGGNTQVQATAQTQQQAQTYNSATNGVTQ